MRFLHYLKDNLFLKAINRINFILDETTIKILDEANIDIDTYFEENYLDFELYIGSNPQQLLQDYSIIINDISLVYEKHAMQFTTSIEFITLALACKESAEDALAFGIDRINEEIEDFNKKHISEALTYLQEQHELRVGNESKDIH